MSTSNSAGSNRGGKRTFEIFQLSYDVIGSNAVDITEGAATERRETDAEDRADVAIARRSKNSLLETSRRLVDHRQHAPIDDLSSFRYLVPLVRRSPRRPFRRRFPFFRRRRTDRIPSRPFRPVRPAATTRRIASDGAMRGPNASDSTRPTFPPTSIPTSSSSVIGPTGNPKSTSASSIESIDAPSSSKRPASFMYADSVRVV